MTDAIEKIKEKVVNGNIKAKQFEELFFGLLEVIEIADDCLIQCADQGKIMPGEYDDYLDAKAKLEELCKRGED